MRQKARGTGTERRVRPRGRIFRAAVIVETWLLLCFFIGWLSCSRRTRETSEWAPVRPPSALSAGGGEAAPAVSPPEASPDAETGELLAAVEKLRPLHGPLAEPGPHDWLARHEEPGQTFIEYVRSNPTLPRGRRRVIHIQPLGEFTESQRRIVELTAEFMGLYFNLPVKMRDDLPLSLVPETARRTHPTWGDRQLLTGYILRNVLRPRLPEDAACYIGFTASDLWPGRGWNYVFGEATIRERVGVWSIYRFGDPGNEFRLCLLRTMKLASHETGHMFSMLHCVAYECNMCGCNHLQEADSHPLWLCPECAAKVCWATGADPAERYGKLAGFSASHGLEEEAAFYRRSVEAMRGD